MGIFVFWLSNLYVKKYTYSEYYTLEYMTANLG